MTLSTAWVALTSLRNIGHKTLDSLLQVFGSAEDIIKADAKSLKQVKGVGAKIASAITAIDLPKIERDIDEWKHAGIKILMPTASDYPEILKKIPEYPLLLFALGDYQPQKWQPSVAIVGTRRAKPQSKSIARQLSEAYTQQGWTVISGLAFGIDAEAHQGALRQQGRTIAVLGGGVQNIYPHQHQTLAQQIIEQGALLSENIPSAEPTAPRLVRRNRIISGLCQHVVVVESAADGGAMYAARAGFSQNRTIYTVDAPFSGNQALLREGATSLDPLNPMLDIDLT